MLTIIKKIIPILMLGILINVLASNLMFFKPDDAVSDFESASAAEAPEVSKDNSSDTVTSSNLIMSGDLDNREQRWLLLKREFEWDVYEILVGTFLVNMFWPRLKMTRELKVLRIGTVIFVALAIHGNLTDLIRLPLGRGRILKKP